MSDLETFAPIARTVVLADGSRLEVLPLRLGQLPAFTKACGPITGSLYVADYFSILEQQPEAAIETICAAGFKRELVTGLYQDETVALLAAIYEVNGDFFIQRLRPAMTKAAAGAKGMMTAMQEAVTAPSSPSSQATATTSGPASS